MPLGQWTEPWFNRSLAPALGNGSNPSLIASQASHIPYHHFHKPGIESTQGQTEAAKGYCP
jgi:hypothetical protein